ncbi:HipA family kinase [Mesorhizobium sp. M1E.F.Ca.ET.063.01.1.1]|uniref:HipA family kinase n=1 Tax=Mesorhizobium sp. M1E.F.Ca.ET.063.01.1.1 TaxID=2496750 RepID=UPI000FCA87B4|nr:HipA family kinase [Mesorhizobium sp. M1E.F.Ca.ET.063.01.1.1]RUW84122.1 hypothetical protein EOA29_10585 [Mesorhizobium sp. M1E.F.Ca.ET.063.01.1.1]
MAEIKFATVLLGALGFKEGNVNETFRGQVLLEGDVIKQAIIKDLDLIQLCNELLAFCLARHVGLPIPDSFLGLVRPGVLSVAKAPRLPDDSRLVFVSTDVKVPNVTFRLRTSTPQGQQAIIDQISKWADLGKLYAFDAWIANIDRHHGNLLFGNPGDAWLIDHGHCFTGPAWGPGDLDPAKEFASRLSEWMTPFLTLEQKHDRRAEAQAVEAALSGFDAAESAKSSRVADLMPMDYVEALKQFLAQRSAKITFHASKALNVPVML